MSDQKTKAVQIINFHGITMIVAEHEGIQYIPLKPINDLLGLAWKKSKMTVSTDDNADLYGTKLLTPPEIEGQSHHKVTQKEVLYIRFDRADMFLSSINISRIRANGKDKAADYLLKIKKSWAEVIHKFETGQTILGKYQHEAVSELTKLLNARSKADTAQRPALDQFIDCKLNELGFPVDRPPELQKKLPLH